MAEVSPLDEAHREVDARLCIEPELVDRHDARVIELARDLRLLEEARHAPSVDVGRRRIRLRAVVPEDDLHRQLATEILVPHAQDRAHAAARDLAAQPVARALRSLRQDAAQEFARCRRRGFQHRRRRERLERDRRHAGRAQMGQRALVMRVQLAESCRFGRMRRAERVEIGAGSLAQELDEQCVS